MTLQERLLNEPDGNLGFVVVWGEDRCPELERFAPEGDIAALPESAEGWWTTAEAPWCVTIKITSQSQEDELISACKRAPSVTGYVVQAPL